MGRNAELLALQKEVLLARSKLQRLRLAHELGILREQVRLPRGMAFVQSSQVRAFGFGALLLLLGRSRLGRLVRIAAVVTAGVKLARELGVRRAPPPATAAAGSPPAPR